MENYFDKQLLAIERELVGLKTSSLKSAAAVETIADSVNLSLPLQLNGAGTVASASKLYKIVIQGNELIMPTTDWHFGDVTQYPQNSTRRAYCQLGRTSGGDMLLQVVVRGDDNDVTTLKNGGSVSLSVELTVRCTGTFTLEAYP